MRNPGKKPAPAPQPNPRTFEEEREANAYRQLVHDKTSFLYRVYRIQCLTNTIALALQVENLTGVQINHIQDAAEFTAKESEELGGDLEEYLCTRKLVDLKAE